MTQSTLNIPSLVTDVKKAQQVSIITRAPLLSLIKYSLWFGKTPDGYVFVGDAADFRVEESGLVHTKSWDIFFPENVVRIECRGRRKRPMDNPPVSAVWESVGSMLARRD